jgi:hypothetical protein
MLPKGSEIEGHCQVPFRLGRITLKSSPNGRGSAICPVLVPFEGCWSIAGLVAVPLRRAPSTASQRRRARRSALRAVQRSLQRTESPGHAQAGQARRRTGRLAPVGRPASPAMGE